MTKSCPKCGADMVIDYGCHNLRDRYVCTEPDCKGEILIGEETKNNGVFCCNAIDDKETEGDDTEDAGWFFNIFAEENFEIGN